MIVTGTQLRGRLTALKLQLDAQLKAFDDSLRSYPGETKDPIGTMQEIARLEQLIVTLQTAQQWYNLQVQIALPGLLNITKEANVITLAAAVKWLGSLSRSAKLWRGGLPSKDRYRMNNLDVRRADDEREHYTLTTEQVIEQVTAWSNAAATLQARIALANTKEIDIPWLNVTDLA